MKQNVYLGRDLTSFQASSLRLLNFSQNVMSLLSSAAALIFGSLTMKISENAIQEIMRAGTQYY